MKRWFCSSQVEAGKIVGIRRHRIGVDFILHADLDLECGETIRVDGSWCESHNPARGGYFIREENGHTFWAEAGEFESRYEIREGRSIQSPEEIDALVKLEETVRSRPALHWRGVKEALVELEKIRGGS